MTLWIWFLGINVLTFLVFGIDKARAKRRGKVSRVPESVLLALAFAGGTPGALTAMFLFRHKVSKESFLWRLGMTVAAQSIVLYFVWQGPKFK